jgi:hypothetical protein
LPSEGKNGDLAASIATGKLRLAIIEFDKFIPKFFGCYGSRFTDQPKIDDLIEQNKAMETWFIKRIGNGKFLNGTETPD